MKTLSNCFTHFLFLFFTVILLAGFSSQTFAQGKKIYVGSGSGVLDYPTAQATLNLHDDDTVMVNAGNYKSMNFENITANPGHKIYIMNSGLVSFSDPSPSNFSNLTNVEIRGDGTPGIDFGFYIHDVIRAIYVTGTMTSVYFSYFKLVNIGDYSIYFYNPSLVYDGTNNPNSLFYDIKLLHFSVYNIATTFLQVGGYTRIIDDGMTNFMGNLEVAYCTIDYTDQEDVLHLNKVVNANVHHNRFSHLGKDDYRHTGIVYLYGNGDVHHNYISDYWGSGLRSHAFSLNAPGAVNVYDNIMVNSRKYSGVEAKATEQEDMDASPYLHYCNFKIYNNTFGDLSAYDWNCSMVDTYDALGGTIEIKNNLGFNIQRDLPYNPSWNFIYQQLNITVPDTSNNLYSQNYVDVGLAEDSSCFLNINSPAIDKGLTFSMVTDDIDGIARPQGAAYDIGAREYVSGVVYPVAKAGSNATVLLPIDSLMLDGSASYNPGGGTLTYKWSEISGPSTAVIVSDTSAKPMLDSLVQGSYQMKLTVTNSQGNTSSSTIVIVASSFPVYPPLANAGGTTTITLPLDSVSLNGAASTSSGGALKYAWTKISGSSSFSISGDTTVAPLLNNLVQGTYQIQLTVTDINGLTNSDIATVIVQPAPVPVANAGADISIVLPVNYATLDGSGSTTPAGGSLTYAWTQISGPASFSIAGANTVNPAISNLVQGTYQLMLTVTNVQGLSAQDMVNVVVNSSAPPVANAGSNITLTLPANSTALDGTASYNPGGGTLTYSWSKVSGPIPFTISNNTTATPLVSNLTAGNYQVQLSVTNAAGAVANSIVVITVDFPLLSIANAGNDTTITYPGSYAILNGSGSYSPDATITSYQWQQITGPTTANINNSTSATTDVTNLEPGVYTFQLTVTDNYGQTSTKTCKVTVVSGLRYLNTINLYPNPCSDVIHVHAITDTLGSLLIRITNMSGIVLMKQTYQKTQMVFDQTIPTGQLPAGMYITEIIMNNEVQLLGKFIKR